MTLDLSCRDWEERIRTGRSLIPSLQLPNNPEGDRAVAIFNKLRLSDVAGTPTMAEAGGDWFRAIVWVLFASLDPATKQRLIRELFLLVPKKNSKTTNGALLMLTALLMNQRPRAPLTLTAPVQDTTDIAFSAAAGAIALDPVLEKKLHVREHLKTIVHRETKAALRIMTFDPAVLTGQKNAAVLIDELHVVARMSKAASAIRQLRGGMVAFPEAFLAIITTQSEEPPAGVFKAELTKARAIRDGKQQGSMLPVLYEFPPSMQKDKAQWRDPLNWHMVTPNLGRPMTVDRLAQDMREAEATSEAELRAWASQHLDVEIGLALSSDSWAGADFWEYAGEPGLTLDALIERCEVIVFGIDGGGLDDLLGLCALGRERDTGRWLHWGHAWAHKIVLDRRKEIAPQLEDFQAEGDLTIVERPGIDVAEVADIICRVRDEGLLPEKSAIGVDAVGIGDIVDELVSPKRGIKLEQIVAVTQGWKLNGAIKTAERKVAGGELVHGGRPLMAWCVGNAKTVDLGNAVGITKQASGKAKIDPLMALFDAVSLMMTNPQSQAGAFAEFLRDPIIA